MQAGTVLLVVIGLIILLDIVGLCIPYWYRKDHSGAANHTSTLMPPNCRVSVTIREGLWARYCEDTGDTECDVDVQAWCEDLDQPEFISFVIALEIVGNLFLVVAIATIGRSMCLDKSFKMEMVGAQLGLGGVLMLVGIIVYAVTDTGEIGYEAADLHAGWGLCVTAGVTATGTCIAAMCIDKRTVSKYKRHYFPIHDDSNTFSDDDELLTL